MLAFEASPLQRALALSLFVGISSILFQLALRLWRGGSSGWKNENGKEKVQPPSIAGDADHETRRLFADKSDGPCSARCRGLKAKAHSWTPEMFHVDQHSVQPTSPNPQNLWPIHSPCQACNGSPPAPARALMAPPSHQQQHPPDATTSHPPIAASTTCGKFSSDGHQPHLHLQSLTFPAAAQTHFTSAFSSKHPAGSGGGMADVVANSAPSSSSSTVGGGGDTLAPDTACRPDNASSAYDTARALVSQSWSQSYTPMFTLGRVSLKIPDRLPSDLPPAAVWTRPYCEALEGEGLALVGAYVRHGCIHIVLDFLDLAIGAGGGGGGDAPHLNPHAALRYGRHPLLGPERRELLRSCSSVGSSRSNSRSNSRRRSGRATGWGEHEAAAAAGPATAVSAAAAATGLLMQLGGRASAPGVVLRQVAPGPSRESQPRLQLQPMHRNAPARVLSADATRVGASGAARIAALTGAAVGDGGGSQYGGDDGDDGDDGIGGAAAPGRLHPLSVRRLRQLRRASVPSLRLGTPELQGLPGAAAAVASPLSSAHGGEGAAAGAQPVVASWSAPPSTAAAASRMMESLTPELLVQLLGPEIGGGGQNVTVQLPLGGGAWAVQMLQAGHAAVAAAAPPLQPSPPDLTCISPPCVLAGAPGPVTLFAAGTDMQGVAAGGHGAASGEGGAAAADGGGPLTVHVRFRGAYQSCRTSLLGDQMPAETLSRVMPVDALRRAEVLCLQLAAPPPQPGVMFIECQRGGLLGAALPVLVAPNAGVWQEVASLQNAAVQEGGGQKTMTQGLVLDLGLWLDYLESAQLPPVPLQQQQQLAPAGEQPPVSVTSASGSGDASGGDSRVLSRAFDRSSFLQLLNDAEHAESARPPQPPQLPLSSLSRRQQQAMPPQQQQHHREGLMQLEEMLARAEGLQQWQQQHLDEADEADRPQWEAGMQPAAAAATEAAAAPEEELEVTMAQPHPLAPNVGVAYGSCPGPSNEVDGGGDDAAAGASEFLRAISDPHTRQVIDRTASAVVAVACINVAEAACFDAAEAACFDAAEAADATCAAGLQLRVPAVPPAARSRLVGIRALAGAIGAAHGGSGGSAAAAVAAWQSAPLATAAAAPLLQAADLEVTRRAGSASAGLEDLGTGSSGWAATFCAGFRAAAAIPAAEVTSAGGSQVSACGLSLAAAPGSQGLYNGRWPLQPSLRAEKGAGMAQQEHGGNAGDGRAPAQTPTNGSSSGGVESGGGVDPLEACDWSPAVSADLLALGPSEIETLSLALMSFGPLTRTGVSSSMDLPPVRADSSRTELRSWDSLTEVGLAGTVASLPLSSGALSTSTAVASPSPSPRPSLHLYGDVTRLRSLGATAAVAAGGTGLAGPRRHSEERATRPRSGAAPATGAAATVAAATDGTPRSWAAEQPQQLEPESQGVTPVPVAAGEAAPGGMPTARVHGVTGHATAAAETAAAVLPSGTETAEAAAAAGAPPAAGIVASDADAAAVGEKGSGPGGLADAAPELATVTAAAGVLDTVAVFNADAAAAVSSLVGTVSSSAAAAAAAGRPSRADAVASALGACWPAAGAEASTRLHARMRQLGLGLLAFSVRRGWVATATELLTGLARVGVGLAEANAGVAAREGGMGLLHLAVTARHPAMLRALPALAAAGGGPGGGGDFSWDVGARGPMGLTPLHLSTALDDGGEVAALLLEGFSNAAALWFTARDDGGCTPAEMAAQAQLEAPNQLARARLAEGQQQPQQQQPVEAVQQLQHDLQAHGLRLVQQQGQPQRGLPREQEPWLLALEAHEEAPSATQRERSLLQQIQGQAQQQQVRRHAAAALWHSDRQAVAADCTDREAGAADCQDGTADTAAAVGGGGEEVMQLAAQRQQQQRQRRGASWLRTSLKGFDDPRVEAQYRGYRAASLGVVDTTCGLVFSCLFLLPALDLARHRRGPELLSHCIFNAGLLGPYLLHALAPALFRRHRDAALLMTDVLKTLLVLLVVLGALPLPRVWVDFARGHMDVLMLVIIKPLAEQIHIRVALLQRAAAVISDAYIYAQVLYGGNLVTSLARSALQNGAALALLLLLDVRARLRFLGAAAAAASSVSGAGGWGVSAKKGD